MKPDRIPRIIHQTWKSNSLPDKFNRFRRSWIKNHPGWEYRFYTDSDCRIFLKEEFPEWHPVYDRFADPALRADLFRYLAVYRFGGLYADIDMECFRPIDTIIKDDSCVFSIEAQLTSRYQAELKYPEPFQIANCVFASVPGHPFLELILDKVKENCNKGVISDTDVEETTGPRMLTRLYYDMDSETRDTIRVLPQIYLMSPREYPNIFPANINMYARHHCAGTWKKDKRVFSLRRLLIERNRLPGLR